MDQSARSTRGTPIVLRVGAVAIGGFLGTAARMAVASAFPTAPGYWPWATFMVNLVGAFVLGCFLERLARKPSVSPYLRLLVGTGFCGGLTTFSTLVFESSFDFRQTHTSFTVLYPAASVVLGVLAAFLGVLTAGRPRQMLPEGDE